MRIINKTNNMKNNEWIKWTFATSMHLIGYIAYSFYLTLKGFEWYHVCLLLLTLFMTVSSLLFWKGVADKIIKD